MAGSLNEAFGDRHGCDPLPAGGNRRRRPAAVRRTRSRGRGCGGMVDRRATGGLGEPACARAVTDLRALNAAWSVVQVLQICAAGRSPKCRADGRDESGPPGQTVSSLPIQHCRAGRDARAHRSTGQRVGDVEAAPRTDWQMPSPRGQASIWSRHGSWAGTARWLGRRRCATYRPAGAGGVRSAACERRRGTGRPGLARRRTGPTARDSTPARAAGAAPVVLGRLGDTNRWSTTLWVRAHASWTLRAIAAVAAPCCRPRCDRVAMALIWADRAAIVVDRGAGLRRRALDARRSARRGPRRTRGLARQVLTSSPPRRSLGRRRRSATPRSGVERQQGGLAGDLVDQADDLANPPRRGRKALDRDVGGSASLTRLGDLRRLVDLPDDLAERRDSVLKRRHRFEGVVDSPEAIRDRRALGRVSVALAAIVLAVA